MRNSPTRSESTTSPARRRRAPTLTFAGRRGALTLAFACVIGLACTPDGDAGDPARTTADDMVAVSRFLVTLDRLHAEAEPAELIERVADDAVVLPPGEPALVGSRAIAERYDRLRARFRLEAAHEVLEVDRFGDVILSRGRVRGVLLAGSSERSAPVYGKYLLVLRRERDGSLRLWRYMINAENGSA